MVQLANRISLTGGALSLAFSAEALFQEKLNRSKNETEIPKTIMKEFWGVGIFAYEMPITPVTNNKDKSSQPDIMLTLTPHTNRLQRLGWNRVFITSLGLLLAWGLRADTYTWVGGGLDNNFSTAANWSGGIAPVFDSVGTNTLIFASGGSYAMDDNTGAGSKRVKGVILNADSDFVIDRNSSANRNFSYLPDNFYAGIPGTTPRTYQVWPNIYFYTNAGVITATNNGVAGGTTLRIWGALTTDRIQPIYLRGDGTIISCSTNGNGALGPVYVEMESTGKFVLEMQDTSSGYIAGKYLISDAGGLVVRSGTAQLNGTGTDIFYDLQGGLYVTNQGVFDLNGHAEKFRSIILDGFGRSGGGALINNSSTAATVTIQSGEAVYIATINGASIGGTGDITIDAALNSPGGLVKVGPNTLTLTGWQNNSVAGITVNQGTLILNKDPSSGGQAVSAVGLVVNNGGIARLVGASEQIYDNIPVTATNGGVFDVQVAAETMGRLSLSGTGIGGAGALINSSSTLVDLYPSSLSLDTDAAIGGTGDITIHGGLFGDGALTKVGNNILTLKGTNVANGLTTVSAGTLAISESGSLSGSVSVASAGTFDVTGLSVPPFTMGNHQVLSNSASATGKINGSVDASVGTIAVTFASGTPALTVANGTLTLASGTEVNVNNTGAQLALGTYKLISAGSGGSVGGVAPSLVTVGGSGAAGAAAVQISSGELYLAITSAAPAPTNITLSVTAGNQLVLDWPAGQGWQLQAQTNSTGITTTWFNVTGATPPWTNSIDPANPSVFYRLKY